MRRVGAKGKIHLPLSFACSDGLARAVHQAYLPIVAASTRAATLHYCCNDREFAWGPVATHDHAEHAAFARGSQQLLPQVLLIDAGCEWDNYASDSTSAATALFFFPPVADVA